MSVKSIPEHHGRGGLVQVVARGEPRRSRRMLIAVALGLAVAIALTWQILITPGWIEYTADFSIHVERDVERANWSGTWNPYTGDDNSATLSQSPPYLLLLIFLGTAATQKTMLFAVYALMAGLSFLAIRSWTAETLGRSRMATAFGLLGGALYTVNPWVAVESVHLWYLVLYALLPLTFHACRRALSASDLRGAVRWIAVAGLTGGLTMTAYGIAFHAVLVGVMLFVHLLARPREPGIAPRMVLLLGVYVATIAGVSMYWLLPIAFGFRTDFSQGTSWALFTTKDMFSLSPYTSIPYAVAGSYRDVTSELASLVTSPGLVEVARAPGYALAVAAVIGVARCRRRTELALLSVAGLALVLANGTNPPTGRIYASVAQAPFLSRFAFVLFKGPYKWVAVALCCLMILAVKSLAGMWMDGGAWRVVSAILTGAIVFWALALGSPLLTGDLAGLMRPVALPPEYRESLGALPSFADRASVDRAVWLPVDRSGSGTPPAWAPQRPRLPLIDGGLSPLAMWTSPVPLSSRGVSWLGPARGRLFDMFVERTLRTMPQARLGSFLLANGRRYVIVRTDASPNADGLVSLLSARDDVRRLYSDNGLAVFDAGSAPLVQRSGAAAVAVGGLELLLAPTPPEDLDLVARPHILMTDLPKDPRTLERILRSAPLVTFAPGRTWLDVALASWIGPGEITEAASLVKATVPLSSWDKDAFDSHLWIPARLDGLKGDIWDPPLSSVFLVAQGDATLSVPFRGQGPRTEFWVRTFASRRARTMSASVDGRELTTLDLGTSPGGVWRWLPLGSEASSRDGRYTLELEVTGSLVAIDTVAILPEGAASLRARELRGLVGRTSLVSGGRVGSVEVAPSTGARTLYVPRSGGYAVKVLGHLPSGNLQATIAGRTIGFEPDDTGWLSSQELHLEEGTVSLDFDGTLSRNAFVFLIDEADTDAASEFGRAGNPNDEANPNAAAGPSSSGAGMITFRQPFHPGWMIRGSNTAPHVRVNGFVNGYLTPSTDPVFEFGPDRFLMLGRALSAATAALVMSAWLWPVMRRRRRNLHDSAFGQARCVPEERPLSKILEET